MEQSRWRVTIKTPVGERTGVLELQLCGNRLTGSMSDAEHHAVIEDGRVNGNKLTWVAQVSSPLRLSLKFSAILEADKISGHAKHFLGSATFFGERIPPEV